MHSYRSEIRNTKATMRYKKMNPYADFWRSLPYSLS